MAVTYSAVVRSIGRNPYLDRLLESLFRQTCPPEEVVISIPRNVSPWEVGAPTVRFVHSDRGAVSQRAEGILQARNDKLLLLDDDVVLEGTAAAALMDALVSQRADCIVPYSDSAWPTGVKRWICAASGIALPRRTGGITYTAGGGYYYPLTEPPPQGWETAGGLGQVIALNRSFAVERQLLGDRELDKWSPYQMREDGIFILALSQAGGKCLTIPGVHFVHLGTARHSTPGSVPRRYQAEIDNQYFFWKKYIRPAYANSFPRTTRAQFLLGWHLTGNCALAVGASLRAGSLDPLRGILRGLKSMLRMHKALSNATGGHITTPSS